MYAHIDCNNFYASCERVFRPDLQTMPIVVLSNNDGCVIAMSNEAKKMGIKVGAPAFLFEKTFNEKGIKIFSANFRLYGDLSNRIMDILSEYTPEIELYSIDEAFLKFSGFEAHFNIEKIGNDMQNKIHKWVGIPTSVGLANTKALAKVATRIAKKFPEKTHSVYCIENEEQRIKALKWLAIEDVWGIGRQLTKILLKQNIKTAYEFTQMSDSWVKKNMSIIGLRLKADLSGIPTLTLEDAEPKKSITCTRSFERNYSKLEELEERISTFACSCAEKLRKQKSNCNKLMVFIHTNFHKPELEQYSRSIVIDLAYPTNSDIELSKFAQIALRKIFKEGCRYKKAGVVVSDFTSIDNMQINLFENSNPKHIALMPIIDKINFNFGNGTIRLATQDKKRWKMKQEKLSPNYTTDINEIITVYAH